MNKVIVAPLNWGLGHATRCIPIIQALIRQGFEPIIASDGAALLLLQKEFPELRTLTLPSYSITYPKKGLLHWHFFKQVPRILKAIRQEKSVIEKVVTHEKIHGIISDNRFGVYHNQIPSIYLTHQLNVHSGLTTWLSSKLHQKHLRNYDEVWVPDIKGSRNLSGHLGHAHLPNQLIKYVGALSRLRWHKEEKKYEYLIILSGPEPQRSYLEKEMLSVFDNRKESVVVIKGCIDGEIKKETRGNITIYNYVLMHLLEKLIAQSHCVISRSGYSTIMDLYRMRAKACFIPTPSQYEQQYLAKYLDQQKIVPFFKQHDFNVERLKNKLPNYKGFDTYKPTVLTNSFDFTLFR